MSAVAAAAAATAVAGALVQGGDTGGAAHGQTTTAAAEREPREPALELAVLDRDDAEARAIRAAERLYETGRRAEARRRFEAVLARAPASVEAAVGAAIAAWPDRTIERLRRIVARHPASAVARLNLGLALVAEGRVDAARTAWREAERVDPDSAAALRAEDLLNPASPPGRPRFLAAGFPRDLAGLRVEERLAELRRRARAGGARDWLALGSALEQAGRRVSARRAYERAVAREPSSLEARVAAAVVRFDKDEPERAFSRLGPLAARNPRAPVVRFHLGLMLLWLPSLDEGRRQLELARDADPDGFYGRQAARILERLPGGE